MRFVRRAACALLTAAMLLCLAPARTDAADMVFFTAVNEQLLPLNDETMPFWSGGVLYIHSSALDGTDLGTHYSRSRDRKTAVVYMVRNAITFDLTSGTCTTSTGYMYSSGAVVRGDAVFLPLDLVCRFFALEYSYTRIAYGYLVRVRSSAAALSDDRFINAASALMAQRYSQYVNARAPSSADNPSGTPTGPATPATPAPEEQPAPERVVYLAFEATGEEETERLFSQLGGEDAALLFSPQTIASSGGLLRRMISEGVPVALRLDGSGGAEDALRRIEEANRALWNAANAKTRLVRLDGASEDTLHAVREAGYCPLRFAVDYGEGLASVSRVSTRIFSAADANGGSCRAFLGTDEAAAGALGALLTSLHTGNCTCARLSEVSASP